MGIFQRVLLIIQYNAGNIVLQQSDGILDGIGGLAGYLNSAVSNSYSSGTISASGSVNYNIGGLIGLVDTHGQVTQAYTTNSSSINSFSFENNIGGLVGENLGSIQQSYSASSISLQNQSNNVGGLVGYNSGNGVVANSYSVSPISVRSNLVKH